MGWTHPGEHPVSPWGAGGTCVCVCFYPDSRERGFTKSWWTPVASLGPPAGGQVARGCGTLGRSGVPGLLCSALGEQGRCPPVRLVPPVSGLRFQPSAWHRPGLTFKTLKMSYMLSVPGKSVPDLLRVTVVVSGPLLLGGHWGEAAVRAHAGVQQGEALPRCSLCGPS